MGQKKAPGERKNAFNAFNFFNQELLGKTRLLTKSPGLVMIELNMGEFKSLDVIYEEAKQRRAIEFSRIDALEKKISIIIATNLAFFLVLISRINFTDWSIYQIFLGFLSLGLFILSLISSLRAISVVKYRIDPEIGPLIENYLEKEPYETKKVLVMNYKETIMQINGIGNTKAALTKSAFRFLCVGLVFCVLSILINTIHWKGGG